MLLLTAAWLGCAGDPPGTQPTDDTTDTGPTTTGPRGDDEGSLVLQAWQPAFGDDAQTVFLGVFAASRLGVLNLAQCLGPEGFCADALPEAPGDSVVVTAIDDTFREQLETVQAGNEIRLGPWSAMYSYDSDTGVGYYFQTETGASLPSEPVGVTLGGYWGAYVGEPDIPVPSAIEVTSPDPMRQVDLYDSAPLDLQWVPGGEGTPYLVVVTNRESRVFLLEDDGQESIDLTPLNLADGAFVEMTVGRWTVTPVDVRGNDLNVQIQSNQRIHAVWRATGPRSELTELYDECSEAGAAPAVPPGSYTGDLAGHGRDLDPGTGGCTGYQARGPDAIVPIDLLPDDLLTVNYQLLSDDASLYLLTDCDDPVGTCVDGSDDLASAGSVEQAVYLNTTGDRQRIFAVLDAFDTVTGPFNLDIIVESIGGDVLLPTCVEAMDQGPVTTGVYHGTLSAHADYLDPACASPANGGEGMLQVYLQPGESVTADVHATGADPKIYLMYNCAIADSCFFADDSDATEDEELRYTNATGVAEYFYLVVDGATNLGEYELDLVVQ
ncbi:MAG: hypothetical protein R3F59_07845 [Myxococcota bacterium]